jgi:hypothetical protein
VTVRVAKLEARLRARVDRDAGRREPPPSSGAPVYEERFARVHAQALENLAAYVVKNPLSLQRLVYLDGQQAVFYKALKHNPTLGGNFEIMHPLEWLARWRITSRTPENIARSSMATMPIERGGDRAAEPPGEETVESEPTKGRRGSASWARLIAKVFHADPLTCRKCPGKLKIVAYLHDQVAIKEILDHLGLSPPEHREPPPAVYEVLRVPGL